jgi:uncharacterized protein (DUF2252 family)
MTERKSPAHLSVEERIAKGRLVRKDVPRTSFAGWVAPPDRRDPLDILVGQSESRLQDLVPIRYGRMSVSPFTFLRGTAAVMAADFAGLPRSGLTTQLCGDCHLYNFGAYASPERQLLFDVNDFDETLPGPFEWDLRRLVVSFVTAARDVRFSDKAARAAAQMAVKAYRETMRSVATQGELATWYDRIGEEDIYKILSGAALGYAEEVAAKAKKRDNLQAFNKLTVREGDRVRIKHDPPLLVPVEGEEVPENVFHELRKYLATLPDDRRRLLEHFEPVDVARKVVGVGSVGTRCWIVLGLGRDADDPLFLQIKEANASVLEPYLGKSAYPHHGRRVVEGQRLMQSASDNFLGWAADKTEGVTYYWRQLRDMKGSVTIETMDEPGLALYAGVCGWALAYAHARGGDRIAIASYIGKTDRIDKALADFAVAYADQNERDYEGFMAAISSGRIVAETGF